MIWDIQRRTARLRAEYPRWLLLIALLTAAPVWAASVACTPDPGFTRCMRITASGAQQSFTVPTLVTSLGVKIWGAGGGGNNNAWWASNPGGASGGFSQGTVAVTPGTVLGVVVGKGGVMSSNTGTYGGGGGGGVSGGINGSSGGGYAGLFSNNTDPPQQSAALLIAGGGGGTTNGAEVVVAAGAGGGISGGQDGNPTASGRGGTQTAGGAGASDTEACTATTDGAGVALRGGTGYNTPDTVNWEGGGGGGGGFFGGGGGRCQNGFVQNGAGGGGSSFIAGAGVTAANTIAGNNSVLQNSAAAPNTTDSQYVSGVGVGSGPGSTAVPANGGDGMVVIQWNPPPMVTVRKISQGSTGAFNFSGSNGIASHSITTATVGTAVAGTTQNLNTPNTATTVTEAAPSAGFVLSAISCTGLGAGGTATPNLATRTVTLDAAATPLGSTITCTFTNVLQADLSVQKTSAQAGVRSGDLVDYVLTVNNAGPAGANGAVLRDAPGAGLDCSDASLSALSCSASAGAVCPAAGSLTRAALLSSAGIAIPTLPTGGGVVVNMQCRVTASGTS